MYVSDFNIIICLSTISLPSPQPVSNSAVCLCKFHWLRCNILIINIDKFLQRGRILMKMRSLNSAFFIDRLCCPLFRGDVEQVETIRPDRVDAVVVHSDRGR